MQKYSSNFALVRGSKLHYWDVGSGDPVLFLHGMPTSCYLWRNIIPALSDYARCVAPDLIGMGASDKPDIDYRIFDHIAYIDGFIQELGLKNITLVMHGWGSVIGFDYARRHPTNIKALAFYEAHLQPVTNVKKLSLPMQHLASLLHRPGASYRAIVQQNYLINKLMQTSTARALTEEELAEYRKPFPTPESRELLWRYVQDLPLGDGPEDVNELIDNYSEWLEQTNLPKLMIYGVPGFMTNMETVHWAKDHLHSLTLAEIDHTLHFAQETYPALFGAALQKWYLSRIKGKVEKGALVQ